jgi:hypothetical protein
LWLVLTLVLGEVEIEMFGMWEQLVVVEHLLWIETFVAHVSCLPSQCFWQILNPQLLFGI